MTSKLQEIRIEEHMGCIAITLNRPERMNAMSQSVRLELARILEELAARPRPPAVVLSSHPEAFSSGQDLSEARSFPVEYISAWIDEHMKLYRAVVHYPAPLVAAVDGCCVGAGFQIALLSDIRIATTRAYFAMPEVDDAIPCILGVWTLWDLVGRGRTTELVLTGRPLPADEALRWGVVSRVVESEALAAVAIETAQALARKPALAVRLTKERLRLLALQEDEELAVHAKYAHSIAFASGQPREAIQQFLDKKRDRTFWTNHTTRED